MNRLILNIDGVITNENIPMHRTHIQVKIPNIDKYFRIPLDIYLFLRDIDSIQNTEIYYLSEYAEKANTINRKLKLKEYNILKDIKDFKAHKKDNIVIVDSTPREEPMKLLSAREKTAIILTENNAGLSRANMEIIKNVLNAGDLSKF